MVAAEASTGVVSTAAGGRGVVSTAAATTAALAGDTTTGRPLPRCLLGRDRLAHRLRAGAVRIGGPRLVAQGYRSETSPLCVKLQLLLSNLRSPAAIPP